MANRKTTTRGFKRTSSLLQDRIKRASASRGFEQSRLLTQWTEIAGEAIAAISRPVNVSYSRGGFGATLTVLTTGPQAPMLEMQKEKLREKVNGVYGYNAISRILITQTAATGFADGQASFEHRAKPQAEAHNDPQVNATAAELAAPVGDANLRLALAALGANVLSKQKS
ncbi:DUF721 domain-containing protein [Roseovarius pelagicus]|uniref:DUF721 domain-containing protein n=1 Tax=Roseovarius pelagicus TaxID=2980108 RepID=A0ABY6D7S7_9RHOB|nr:DUF721 domain-containing protein [Roseovarius pelagicus]UXX81660.1 DUF721 domain-containing protein [Roseovarius pelagicus]